MWWKEAWEGGEGGETEVERSLVAMGQWLKREKRERETGSGIRAGKIKRGRRRQEACKYVTKECFDILTVLEQFCHNEGSEIHVAGLSWMCVKGWCRNLRPAKCLNVFLPLLNGGFPSLVCLARKCKVESGFNFPFDTTRKGKTSRLAAALKVTSRTDTSWGAGCRMYGRRSL